MDPLSITAGVIAVLQAGDRLTGLLAQLKPFFEAPEEVDSLSNEVIELQLVLGDLQKALPDLPGSGPLPANKSNVLHGLVKDGETILLQLEELLQRHFIKLPDANGTGTRKVRRLAWVKKRGRVEKLRRRLRDLRLTIAVQLSSMNLLSQTKIKLAVDEVALLSNELRSRHINLESEMTRCFNQQGSLLSQILQAQQSTQLALGPQESTGSLQDDEVNLEQPRPTSSLAQNRQSYRSTPDGVGVRAIRYNQMSCKFDCDCSCHSQKLLRPAPLLNSVLGRLFIGYTGTPFLDKRCDTADCRRRSLPAVHVIYYFPRWFFTRALFLTVSNTLVPCISLTFPRVIPGGSTIFRYIRFGNTEGVKELFTQGQASPADICGASGLSVLSYALMSYALYGGCIEVCEILISEGADPFALNNTALASSASDEAWDMLYDYSMEEPIRRALRNLVPEPSNLASRSLSKLHKTVLGITPEPLNALLRASRANINDVDSSGRSVLHWAAYMGDEDMLNAILRCGADPDLRCIAGRTPVHYGARVGAHRCVASLIDAGADLNIKDKQGETALHLASDCKRNDVMKLLLEAGADPQPTSHLGEAPLAYAATENNVDGASLLLKHGASIDAADLRGYTALLDALWANAHEVAEFLISSGARSNVKTYDGMTVLHFVAQQGDIRMMEILENANISGLDQNALNTEGCTALQILRQRGDLSDQVVEAFGALLITVEISSRADAAATPDSSSGDDEESFTLAVEALSDEVFSDAEAY